MQTCARQDYFQTWFGLSWRAKLSQIKINEWNLQPLRHNGEAGVHFVEAGTKRCRQNKKWASGKECCLEIFRFRSEQSSLTVFSRCTEREDNHVLMWNKGPDWGLIKCDWIVAEWPVLFFYPHKKDTYQCKKKYHNSTSDRWTTKKSHLQSLTRWIAHCAAGTFPSASG